MLLGLASIALAALAPVGPGVPPVPTAICAPQVVGYDASADRSVLDSALIETLGPSQLLRSLGALTPLQLRQFVEDDEAALRELIAEPPSPQEVELWWKTMDASEQSALQHGAPELLGNLDGVPYDVRDRANREKLAQDQAAIRERLSSGIGKGEAALAVARLKMLQQIDDSLQSTDAGPRRSLLMLDTVMPGRAAVALGDLDTADYVSLLVPGALLSVREHMREWTKVTADIYDEQTDWLNRFHEASTVATVSWIGYRTPDVTNVAGMELAEEGASFLSGTVNGLHVLRERDEPYVSVFAHSYGATAATLALDRGDMSIDALAMIGSPGGPAASAADLKVSAGNVWVGEAAWDPVVNTAFFGTDPGSPRFGAKTMSVAGSLDPVTGAQLTASVGHDWYLEPGTESLRNLSLIGIDRGDWVTDGSGDDSRKTLALAR
jgi:hypothetical protein